MKRMLSLCVVLFLAFSLSPAWGQAEFPESWKGTIPEYPGAVVELSLTNADGTTVHMEVEAGPKEVTDYYRDAMSEKGWTVDMDMSHEGGSTLVLNEGTRILNVTAVTDPGEKRTRVVLTLMSE